MKTIKNSLILSAVLVAMGAFTTLSAGNVKKEKSETEVHKPQNGWYVSTTVSVLNTANDKTYKGTNPAVLGRLDQAVDGFGKYDVPTFVSVVTRKAAVVFVKDDWDERSGEYHGDFHDTKGQKDSWEMTVFSSVPDAEVTLEWDGLYALTANENGFDNEKILDSRTLEDLHLVDTVTGEVTDAIYDGQLNTYTFDMGEEGSRTFIWALGRGNSYKTSKGVKTYIKEKQKEERAKAKEEAKLRKEFVKNNRLEKFGLPPM